MNYLHERGEVCLAFSLWQNHEQKLSFTTKSQDYFSSFLLFLPVSDSDCVGQHRFQEFIKWHTESQH